MFGFFSDRRNAKQRERLNAWLELFEPGTKEIIKWWEEERRAECLSRLPKPDERDAGFEKAWRNIQSLQIEGHKATLWLYKPRGTFAATVDLPSDSSGKELGWPPFPGGPVMPRRELAERTPEEAVENLRKRIKSPNYNAP